MFEFLILIILIAIAYYCISYGLWAWHQKLYRGALGTFIMALLTLLLPVAVWIFHNYLD